jgi:hypothetical protein
MPSAAGDKCGRDAVGPSIELGPAEAAVTLDQGGSVGEALRVRLPHISEVPTGHTPTLRSIPHPRSNTVAASTASATLTRST